jgi:hypothetical protein
VTRVQRRNVAIGVYAFRVVWGLRGKLRGVYLNLIFVST